MTEQDRAKTLQRVLERQAMRLVPEHADVWPHVAVEIQPQRRARALPQTRVGWVMASLMLLVVLGAAGFGGYAVVGQESFTILSGQKPDVVRHLGYTQTVDGVSVTLERVYVNGDQIGVEALVTGMPEPYRDESGLDHRFFARASLTALDGTILRSGGGSIATTYQGDTVGQPVTVYEMSRTQGASSELPLRAEVSVLEFIIDQNDPNWVVDPQTFAGPVIFELTVPLEDGR